MKLRGGMMPPQGMPRPDEATLEAFAAALEKTLDAQALQLARSRATSRSTA